MPVADNTVKWAATFVMPTLDVTDLQAAIGFYCKIGFREKWRYPDPGGPSPLDHPDGMPNDAGIYSTHAAVGFGRVELMLAVHERESSIHRQNIYVFMTNLLAYHAFLRAALGAESVPDPKPYGYGMTDFSISDPWGHRLSFGEKTEGLRYLREP